MRVNHRGILVIYFRINIYINELYPLKKVTFEDTTIMVPSIEKNVLYRNFSDKCLTTCKISNHVILHHGFFNSKKLQEFVLEFGKHIDDIDKIFNISKKNSLNMINCNFIKNMLFDPKSKLINNKIISKLLN